MTNTLASQLSTLMCRRATPAVLSRIAAAREVALLPMVLLPHDPSFGFSVRGLYTRVESVSRNELRLWALYVMVFSSRWRRSYDRSCARVGSLQGDRHGSIGSAAWNLDLRCVTFF